MSHVQTVETEFHSAELLQKSCEMLGHTYLGPGTYEVYSRTVSGLGFQLKDWRQPCVANPETGKVTMDNSQGHWGDISIFNRLKQRYGVEVAKDVATKRNLPFREVTLADNRIALEIDVPEQKQQQVVTI
jgi:hypothetical protein